MIIRSWMTSRRALGAVSVLVIAVAVAGLAIAFGQLRADGGARPEPRSVLIANPVATPVVTDAPLPPVANKPQQPDPPLATPSPSPAPTRLGWSDVDAPPPRWGGQPLPPLPPVSPSPTAPPDATITSTGPLKAVIIVGPSAETGLNLERAEQIAARAEKYGMDVRRVYSPYATWRAVADNIEGANLVAYFGHGNGWPSPYGSFQERTKNGFGLDGGTLGEMTYYGADVIARKITLAPNAVVILSHLCYSAGNAEPGMSIPTWDVAVARVDNMANGFLRAGAGAVFAYGTGNAAPIVDALFTTEQTVDEIFMTPGARRLPYYGFTGWDDRYFDSVRVPGTRNHLDPGRAEGFLRALTGNLEMTAAEWLAGASEGDIR